MVDKYSFLIFTSKINKLIALRRVALFLLY